MDNINIEYHSHKFSISGLETCSITQILQQTGQFYELDLLEALRAYVSPGQYIVDIGAHIGNHTLFFNAVLGARVLAMEANPEAYIVLKANIEKNGFKDMTTALNVAVSHNTDRVTLTPLSGNDKGTYSILRPTHNSNSFSCKAATLDGNYARYFQGHPPAVIKLDVEGAEAGILSAARKTIDLYKPVLATEVLTLNDFNSVAEIIVPLGYHPVSIHNATPTIIWEHRQGDLAAETYLGTFRYAVVKADDLNALSVGNNKLQAKIKALERDADTAKVSKPQKVAPDTPQGAADDKK